MYRPTTALQKIAGLKKPTRIIQGSQGAGKTIGIEIGLIDYAIHYPDSEITIMQAELSKLKKTAMRDFEKIMKGYNLWDKNAWNKSDSTYSIPNGSYIEFIGLDKADIGKGFRRDIIYFNELNKGGITLDTFVQFSSRAKLTFADYNPDRRFWVHDEIIPDKDTDFLKLTFLDNEYLPYREREEILKYREKGFHDIDAKELFAEENIKSKWWANKWRVYGLGEVGFLDGVVFENWKVGRFNPDEIQTSCGLDFGFSVDPDALIEVAIDTKKKKIYLKEHIYQRGLRSSALGKLISNKIGRKKVIADSADPRLIADLESQGVNVEAVKKGKIEEGITRMLDYELIIDPESINIQSELNHYAYADKGSNLYIDEYNHAIDASRYNVTYQLDNQHAGEYHIW